MSDAHEAMSVFLQTQTRVDEVLSSVHSLASQVEIIGARMDGRFEAMNERLAILEGARPGGKKTVAVAASVGTAGGAFGTLISNGGLDVVMALLKKFGL